MDDKQYYELRRSIKKVETMVMDIYDAVIPDNEKRYCPVCKNRLRLYLPAGAKLRYNVQCPVCHSLERHRALCLFLDKNIQLFRKENVRLLHFAPEGGLFNRFMLDENIDYWPVDINPNACGGRIRKVIDITNIAFDDDSIDIIMCSHVLEHILEEKKALSELYRILKPDGVVFIMVPVDFGRERTLENPEWNTPELRLKYYNQEDHVRIYGKDFPERLKAMQFNVEVVDMNKDYSDKELVKYGLYRREELYLCRKN